MPERPDGLPRQDELAARHIHPLEARQQHVKAAAHLKDNHLAEAAKGASEGHPAIGRRRNHRARPARERDAARLSAEAVRGAERTQL